MRERAGVDQRGFTLLELMIVVAIVAILAAVAVPAWTRESREKRYDPEIAAMFTELQNREEQYKSELGNGAYIATTAACPTTPIPAGIDFNTVCAGAAPWTTLHVVATDSQIRCSYSIAAGPGTTAPGQPAPCSAPPANYAGAWYYVLATCDMDSSGGTNATFCVTSWDTHVTNMNYGK